MADTIALGLDPAGAFGAAGPHDSLSTNAPMLNFTTLTAFFHLIT